MIWVALALAALWAFAAWHDLRAVVRLPELPPRRADAPVPDVTVVMAVRDDVQHVEPSVRHLLAQEHVRLRLVVVDDRREDGSGDELACLAADEPRLQVVTVRELPPDWLGKSHALHVGTAGVATRWILFTDADAHLAPEALARAIDAAEHANAQHVSLLPTHRHTTLLGRACLLAIQLVRGRARGGRQPPAIGASLPLCRAASDCRDSVVAAARWASELRTEDEVEEWNDSRGVGTRRADRAIAGIGAAPAGHLVTYHRVLAPAASLRSRIVPGAPDEEEEAGVGGDGQQGPQPLAERRRDAAVDVGLVPSAARTAGRSVVQAEAQFGCRLHDHALVLLHDAAEEVVGRRVCAQRAAHRRGRAAVGLGGGEAGAQQRQFGARRLQFVPHRRERVGRILARRLLRREQRA